MCVADPSKYDGSIVELNRDVSHRMLNSHCDLKKVTVGALDDRVDLQRTFRWRRRRRRSLRRTRRRWKGK